MRAVSSSSPSVKKTPPDLPGEILSIRPHASLAAGVCVFAAFAVSDFRRRTIRFDMDRSVLAAEQSQLTVGQWLTFSELQALARAGEQTFVVAAAVAMVARREHSRAEIARKLHQKGYSSAATEYALERLHQRNYQSDSRFAREWVRSHMSGSGRSRRALLAGLQRAGVDRDVAEAAVRDYGAGNPGCFQDALARAAAAMGTVPDEKKIQRLLRRGFDFVEIKRYFD